MECTKKEFFQRNYKLIQNEKASKPKNAKEIYLEVMKRWKKEHPNEDAMDTVDDFSMEDIMEVEDEVNCSNNNIRNNLETSEAMEVDSIIDQLANLHLNTEKMITSNEIKPKPPKRLYNEEDEMIARKLSNNNVITD